MSIVTTRTESTIDARQLYLEEYFAQLTDGKFPHRVRVGINSSARALATKNGVLVRHADMSNDHTWEIFIDPREEDPMQVGILLAEAAARIHAGLLKGTNKKHEAIRVNLGLGESALAPRLNAKCKRIVASLPDYSTLHAGLNDDVVKARTQTTRNKKWECDEAHADGKGTYRLLITASQSDRGAPLCGACATDGNLNYMVDMS
jgi:hypothetical protein